MKRLTFIFEFAVSCVLAAFLQIQPFPCLAAQPEKSLPVAPVPATDYLGWTNSYRLANAEIMVVAVPAIGRIMHIGSNASNNLLSVNQSLQGVLPSATNNQGWLNFGGDWLFPVAQKRWPDFQGNDWPPSRLLDGRSWSGRAWKNADQSQCCLLQQEYGAPLHIKISRLLTVPPHGTTFTVEQRIERLQESSIPVTLWNISQLSKPDAVYFPTDRTGPFTNGYVVMMGGQPDSQCLSLCENSIAYDTSCGSEVKFGSSSPECWVAGQCGRQSLIEHARSDMRKGAFPDGGCSIEIYANKGLGYAEIENLSIEKSLNPGESLVNTLYFHLHTHTNVPDACDFTATIRESYPLKANNANSTSTSSSK